MIKMDFIFVSGQLFLSVLQIIGWPRALRRILGPECGVDKQITDFGLGWTSRKNVFKPIYFRQVLIKCVNSNKAIYSNR